MDILLHGIFTGLGVILLRVGLLFLMGILVFKMIKPFYDVYLTTKEKEDCAPIPSLKKYFLYTVGLAVGLALFFYSFAYAAYVPKVTVVGESSRVQYELEVQRNEKQLQVPIEPSEADKKAAARKSEINIREKFEQLPDK